MMTSVGHWNHRLSLSVSILIVKRAAMRTPAVAASWAALRGRRSRRAPNQVRRGSRLPRRIFRQWVARHRPPDHRSRGLLAFRVPSSTTRQAGTASAMFLTDCGPRKSNDERELVPHLLEHRAGNEDAARLGQRLQTRRDVDALAEEVVAFDEHVAEIDADAKIACAGRAAGSRSARRDRAECAPRTRPHSRRLEIRRERCRRRC